MSCSIDIGKTQLVCFLALFCTGLNGLKALELMHSPQKYLIFKLFP